MKQAGVFIHDPDQYADPPPEAVDAQAKRDAMLQSLDHFGTKLADCRQEAIDGKKATGIEDQWEEDEDYYEGRDNLNRRKTSAWGSKPLGQGGISETQAFGSRIFPNITRPYVDAASARTSDMLQPVGDEKSWSIKRTVIPELIDITKGKLPQQVQVGLSQLPSDMQEGAMSHVREQAELHIKKAEEAAQKAEEQIADWLGECQYQDQNRIVREDMTRIGVGILKGPIPVIKKAMAYKDGQLIISEGIKPVSVAVSPWNVFPDPACGESIHDGSYIWERDDITYRKLSDLIGSPGYITEQIEKCLSEKAFEATYSGEGKRGGLTERSNKNLFEIWHFYGMADKSELQTALQLANTQDCDSEEGAQGQKVYVQASMVNNHVIRMVLNPLDTGEFPYDFSVWQRIKNLPWGIGIARQARVGQDVVKAGWRNMMDNGGIASGPQVIVNTSRIRPHDGVFDFTPWKLWEITTDFDGAQRLDDAFRFINVPMYQREMATIIEMGNRLVEDSTGLALIMQGQTSASTPDTLGGLELQNNNASTVLRRIARNYDAMTERHIRRYYNYLLQYGEDDAAKGDFVIQALGSSSRVELEINGKSLSQLYPLSKDPTSRIDPEKMAKEIIKANRIDPNRVLFDDAKWKEIIDKLAQQAAAGPQDTSIQVAQIREGGATERKQAELASKENTVERQLQAEAELESRKQQFMLMISQLNQDVTAYQEGMRKNLNDDTLKVKLAETMAKVKAMYDLASTKPVSPPAEPPGRAIAGQAYQH